MRGARAATVLVAVSAACGRLNFGARLDSGVRNDDDGAPPADAPCTLGAWGNAQPVAELASGASDSGGQISADGLTYYFDSILALADDVYVATRASRTAVFGAPVEIANLDGGTDVSDPSATADQLELFFDAEGDGCVFHSTRTDVATPWPPGAQVASLCSDFALTVYVSGDGLTLAYENASIGGLYLTTRAARSDDFEPGVHQAALDQPQGEASATLSGDGLTIYFQSGTPAMIYSATRADLASAFANLTALDAVNTAANNFDASVTADGLELYFSSDVSGKFQTWRATRACL